MQQNAEIFTFTSFKPEFQRLCLLAMTADLVSCYLLVVQETLELKYFSHKCNLIVKSGYRQFDRFLSI